ncbi:DUF4169 family protein [Brevundimonas sp.]|jgi:hypothetical protein|uniref:DUF4169 family protein n=1 Tax=Brevundimonas sp. TaxID=1871086 RepID=UPI0037BF78B1
MAEIINLNRARKGRAKAEDKARAAANRAAHGRTRAQKQSAETDRARAARLLDGQKLDKSED